MKRTFLPYIVVDQNCLRDEHLLENCIDKAKATGELIVLVDTAFIEMTKNAQWELTVQQSLKILAKHPTAVAATYSPGQLLRIERNLGQPYCDVIYHEATPIIQKLLDEVAEGKNDYLKQIASLVIDSQGIFRQEKLNHQQNKNYVAAAVGFWKLVLSEATIKQLRRKGRKLFRELISSPYVTEMCRVGLCALGWAENSADYLAANPSVSSHNFLCIAALGLRYISDGGLESKSDEKITNDVVDLDYLLIATFCKELLTKDVRLYELYKDVCFVIEHRERLNE